MSKLTTIRTATLLLAVLATAASTFAQGIEVKRRAMVLFGSTRSCSRPATIDYKRAQKATPEYRTIRSEGVRKGTARYDLLAAEMTRRINAAVARVAEADNCDCVVRKGDIKDRKGLKVQDLTSDVVDELES